MKAKFVERLQQALRVMQDLTPHQRARHFDITLYARQTDCGTACCIAGFCGLDPWFRRRGFKTSVDQGDVSKFPKEFFGTDQPFYYEFYPGREGVPYKRVTYREAIAALKKAIRNMSDEDVSK